MVECELFGCEMDVSPIGIYNDGLTRSLRYIFLPEWIRIDYSKLLQDRSS